MALRITEEEEEEGENLYLAFSVFFFFFNLLYHWYLPFCLSHVYSSLVFLIRFSQPAAGKNSKRNHALSYSSPSQYFFFFFSFSRA